MKKTTAKTTPRTTNKGKKYAKPLSLYPMKPEEALRWFMQVKPEKLKREAMS